MNRSFAQYIENCERAIHTARSRFYQGDKLEEVTRMSMPFELTPQSASSCDCPAVHRISSSETNIKYKKGILLTHGFLTSPYIMRSLAQDFAKADFLVRAVLLPGHGTYYQDLDHYSWQDWLDTVRFGYESLEQECEEVYLCGFSVGATLSLLIALENIAKENSKLKKIIMLAPCFGISPFATSFPFLIKTKLSRFLPQLFCTQAEKEHLGSYTKFSISSVSEIVKMLKKTKTALQPFVNNNFPIPTYVAASFEDATVKFTPILNFVDTYLNPESHFWVYSNRNLHLPQKVPSTLITANKLDANILAISHVALPVSPADKYFGINGSYYGQLLTNTKFGEPHLTHKIKRLTYNPDYQNLQQHILSWLSTNANDSHLQK